MPIVKLNSGFNIEVEFAVASFFKRLLAWLLDVGFCWLLTRALAMLLNTDSFFVWSNNWDIRGVLVNLPMLFYFLVCEVATNGRSLGKIALNLRVINEDGGQPGLGQYLIRWVLRLIDLPYWIPLACISNVMPWWTFPLVFTGVACIVYTDKSQRVGDIVAGTILIDLKKRASWEDTVFTELSDDYKPKYPQVMQLTDRDVNTLKSIIDTVRRKNDNALASRIAQRIQSKTGIETTDYPIDFLETLLLDYNYYSSN